MASISKNPKDIVLWIKKVILSCETAEQLISAQNLANIFYKKGMNVNYSWHQNYEHRMLIHDKLLELSWINSELLSSGRKC